VGEHVVKKTTDRLVDHHLHCRFEVTNSKGVPRVAELIRSGACTLLSFMDHTPGQGQFGTMDEYRHYLKTAYGFTDDYFDELMVEKFDGNRHAEHNMAILQTVAKQHGIPIASHDDDSAEKVRQMKQFGVTICEFPVDRAAAQQARELQLHAMVGTPNIIRGGSTSPTGISALELISAGQADCLCSDYVPFTMLLAIFKTAEALDWPLNKAAALATANPAQAASLTDRGEVATGKRADLLAVSCQANRLPRVLRLFRAGREVMRVA